MKKFLLINMTVLIVAGLFGTSNFSSILTDGSEASIMLNETSKNLNKEKNLI